MPPKAKIPAPIDKPLSRAYLREFSGWSTAYPPGISEPTSLRVMENVTIGRDGSAQLRPGLRHLSAIAGGAPLTSAGLEVVGTHEAFYLNTGDKAYLFAVRETDGTVGFRVARYRPNLDPPFQVLSLSAAGFATPTGGFTPFRFSSATTYVKYLQIDNKIFALSDAGEPFRVFWVGSEKKVKKLQAVTRPEFNETDKLNLVHPVASWTGGAALPGAAAGTANTLISSTMADNIYKVGFFYTFVNEIGESAPSMVRVRKVQRPWTSWKLEAQNSNSEPNGIQLEEVSTGTADKLVCWPPQAVWDAAVAAGAIQWKLYMMAWSDQDNVPVEGQLVGVRDIPNGLSWQASWIIAGPQLPDYTETVPLPTEYDRNYTEPSSAAQGIVASDRMVLVNDKTSAAVIRWTSNQQGEYTTFSASRGGGYKTLTSGNLFIPACVKLWQNPQSVDTLTVLCMGTDGHSTGYYMAPAQVASQAETVNVMGFEETTATPGTTSPYGCEVMNNALYHPLDTELMKSTANNYNISHKSMTEQIVNKWSALADKHQIVSAQLDNRLYYIVHNPEGEDLQPGCMGNELWVFDAATDKNTWSRWLIQAMSLRKIEVQGQVLMSVVRPDGIFALDPAQAFDDLVVDDEVVQRNIPWRLETNTQGANRAHDAWCHLQQIEVTLGNFSGRVRWGVRGRNLHGKTVEVGKVTRADVPPGDDGLPWDVSDQLRVAHGMREWHFFAESVGSDLAPEPCQGQINLVQYRYTPVSVNVGYDHGSVETFEYGRADRGDRTTENGVPIPMADAGRP